MQKLVSGLLNTDIMNFVDSPECSQPAGACCTSYKGKKQVTPLCQFELHPRPDRPRGVRMLAMRQCASPSEGHVYDD
jgi:hypothetical protein